MIRMELSLKVGTRFTLTEYFQYFNELCVLPFAANNFFFSSQQYLEYVICFILGKLMSSVLGLDHEPQIRQYRYEQFKCGCTTFLIMIFKKVVVQ